MNRMKQNKVIPLEYNNITNWIDMHYYFHVPSVILTIEQTNEIATFAYTNYAQQGIKRSFK